MPKLRSCNRFADVNAFGVREAVWCETDAFVVREAVANGFAKSKDIKNLNYKM
jgi:hypothetical protein